MKAVLRLTSSHKGLRKTPSSFIHVKAQAEDGYQCALLTDAGYAASLGLDLIFSRPVIKCICSIQKPLSLWYSVTVASSANQMWVTSQKELVKQHKCLR